MKTRKLVLMAIFIALGIVLPMAFHFFGTGLASIISPMHIPVFIAGAFMGPMGGIVVGAATPVLSSLLTGMPPVIPMLPIMFVELIIYGGVIGYLFKAKKMNIFLSMVVSMLLGRIGMGVVVWFLVHVFNIGYLPANPVIYIQAAVIKGLPGIIIHLIVVPLVINYLQNSRTIKL